MMEYGSGDTFIDAYNDYLNFQQERQNALLHLEELKRHLQASGLLSETAQKFIEGTNEALNRQRKSLDRLLLCIPVEDRRTESAQSVIDEVFDTAELLENILHFLRLHDALAAQRVSKSFYHAIETSPRIQKQLGFLPDENSLLHVPVPLTTPNIYFYIDDYIDGIHLTADNLVTLNGDIFNGVGKLPTLGSKTRKLLICQPPVKSLSMMADCCYDRFPLAQGDQPPTCVITSKTGVTLGDVIDAAKDLAEEHSTCPNAPVALHDDKGFVQCGIYLSARVTLREDDPRLEKKRQRRVQEMASTSRRSGKGDRMRPYIAAKQAARANGEPIPTLEEFERSQIANGP